MENIIQESSKREQWHEYYQEWQNRLELDKANALARELKETYKHPRTGLTIWRSGTDSKLYIKDETEERIFTLNTVDPTIPVSLSASGQLLTVTDPTSIYVGSVSRKGEDTPFLYIYDFHPNSADGGLKFKEEDVIAFAKKVQDNNPLKAASSFLEFFYLFKKAQDGFYSDTPLTILLDKGNGEKFVLYRINPYDPVTFSSKPLIQSRKEVSTLTIYDDKLPEHEYKYCGYQNHIPEGQEGH